MNSGKSPSVRQNRFVCIRSRFCAGTALCVKPCDVEAVEEMFRAGQSVYDDHLIFRRTLDMTKFENVGLKECTIEHYCDPAIKACADQGLFMHDCTLTYMRRPYNKPWH